MTSPTPSVNYSGSSAPTGINAEFDFDSEMPSSRQPEPQSPSIEEIEQPNSEEPKPKRAKSTTSDVWKSFTKIGVVDGKERARCNGCQKEYIVGGIRYGTSSLLRHIPKCVALPKYHNIGTMMLDAQGKLRSRQLDHIGWETKLDVVKRKMNHFQNVRNFCVFSVNFQGASERFFRRRCSALAVAESKAWAIFQTVDSAIGGSASSDKDFWSAATTSGSELRSKFSGQRALVPFLICFVVEKSLFAR
nr:zinc finger BED domain-containing protein RICESLEEPER 2-like [Ipomoea batatas]